MILILDYTLSMNRSLSIFVLLSLAVAASSLAKADDGMGQAFSDATATSIAEKQKATLVAAAEYPQAISPKDAEMLFKSAEAPLDLDRVSGVWKLVLMQGGLGENRKTDGKMDPGGFESKMYVVANNGKIQRIGSSRYEYMGWSVYKIDVGDKEFRYESNVAGSRFGGVYSDYSDKTTCRLIGTDFLICREKTSHYVYNANEGRESREPGIEYLGYFRSSDDQR